MPVNNFIIKVSNLVKFFDDRKIIKCISFNVTEKLHCWNLRKKWCREDYAFRNVDGPYFFHHLKIEILGKDLNLKK